ncbi:RmlC-like cupin domain-containing protein [Aspergillus varians]
MSVLSPTTFPVSPGFTHHFEQPPARYTLDDLVHDIKAYLGDSNGISSSDIDSNYLISLAKRYEASDGDWTRFYHNDPKKNYTRNAIENINHKANILLLVWNPAKGSPIHDHANAHCIMKVLAGNLRETVYAAPEKGAEDAAPLRMISETEHSPNDVTYIADDIGLHRVHNPSPTKVAVSLHLYTPPNAADYGYHIFDEATGKSSYVPQARAILASSKQD